jgi:hypothetical protein
MHVRAADGSRWVVTRYALRDVPTLAGSTRRAARAGGRPGEAGPISDQVIRGDALGCLVPIELGTVLIGRLVAALAAPFDLAWCALGRRPWPVTARRIGRTRRRHVWLVQGWDQSSAMLREVGLSLRTGRHLPRGES